MIKRKYGWKVDHLDGRDYKFSRRLPIPAVLPAKVDLRPGCSPVEDQGQLGSCTANALVGGYEFLEIKSGVPFWDASRLFVYYFERYLEGTVGEDSGAEIRDGIKVLATYGVCPETMWPYVISKFTKKPCAKQIAEAKKHTIASYYRIDTLAEMKTCLAAGYPFVFGFSVYDSFESDEVAATGVVPMPGPDESLLGGHAVLAVGYDDSTGRFIVRNSWGMWGDKGYCYMPYDYLTDRNLSDDMWFVEK